MKNLSYLIFFTLVISCSEPIVQNNAIIEFEKKEHDFKQMEFNEKAEYSFEFSNLGNSPIIVHNVETSCGCTLTDWPKEPVKPSQKGKIIIKYEASHSGIFSKSIKVFYSGKGSPIELKIRGSANYPENLAIDTPIIAFPENLKSQPNNT